MGTSQTEVPPPARRVILGVSGGIAAYKAVELLRLLTESGHDVRVSGERAAVDGAFAVQETMNG